MPSATYTDFSGSSAGMDSPARGTMTTPNPLRRECVTKCIREQRESGIADFAISVCSNLQPVKLRASPGEGPCTGRCSWRDPCRRRRRPQAAQSQQMILLTHAEQHATTLLRPPITTRIVHGDLARHQDFKELGRSTFPRLVDPDLYPISHPFSLAPGSPIGPARTSEGLECLGPRLPFPADMPVQPLPRKADALSAKDSQPLGFPVFGMKKMLSHGD